MMTYEEFLNRVIDDGIEAAKRDYAVGNYGRSRKTRQPDPTQKGLLNGSVAGFEACRKKTPAELGELLAERHRITAEAMRHHHAGELLIEEYWYARGFELEVEWTCNCVSAVLMNEGLPTIVPPTYRGYMQAAKIVGVKKERTKTNE